jgi:hypothetical protein
VVSICLINILSIFTQKKKKRKKRKENKRILLSAEIELQVKKRRENNAY